MNMHKYKYNPEHFHDAEGVLFTVRNAYDETLWEVLTDDVTHIDDVMVRIYNHDNTIECYYQLEDLLKEWFDEGYFSMQLYHNMQNIMPAYEAFAKRTGLTIPANWKL